MRAALMQRGRIWVDNIDAPVPGPGEVLVKSLACGICGSDLHATQHTEAFVKTSREAGGAFKLTTFEPVVLGHEFCAEVVEHGPATGHTLAVGTRVCSVPALTRKPMLSVGYSDLIPGGFGEYMVLSESLLVPVPDGTPATAAALTEPMAVGYHAVRKARLEAGDACLVIGCGPVGLAVITALRSEGIRPIIATDFSPARRQLAIQQGADTVLDPAIEDAWKDPALRHPDHVVIFECVGVPGMLDQIFLNAPQNARIIVAGVCLQQDQLRPLIGINKELSLQFVLGYSMAEFVESLHRIADGRFDVGRLVTHQIGLDDVAGTFEALKTPSHHAKVMVEAWR
jgi:threonine dehydrogenase-like Zn-dependent dehydrogenase